MSKKNEVSTYLLKRNANKKFKEDTFSLSGLQNYATKCFKQKDLNPDFLQFCSELKLTVNDMQFSHVLNYGKVKELNKVDKTGNVVEKKNLFSFWLFATCLNRYRTANPINVVSEIANVQIDETKQIKKQISEIRTKIKETKKESEVISLMSEIIKLKESAKIGLTKKETEYKKAS